MDDEYEWETKKAIHWLRMYAEHGDGISRLQKYNLEFAAERLDDLLSYVKNSAASESGPGSS
jgi:hypothetical protein